MRAYILSGDTITATADAGEVRRAHAAGEKLWVDLEERSADNERLLLETFAIHPLVVEDIWRARSVPKIDDFDHYLYVVVHGIHRKSAAPNLELAVVDIVIGNSFLITHHPDVAAIETARDLLERNPRLLAGGTPWLAHAVIDAVVDRFLPMIDRFDERLEHVEEQVMHKIGPREDRELVKLVFALKRSAQRLSRIAFYQHDVLQRLSTGAIDDVPKEARPYFRDVYDHWVRVRDHADANLETVTNALDWYLSLQSNRMNETVKALTVISTIMLPLNLICSLYGMNFRYMPELSWHYGYLWALGLMVLVGTSIATVFKWKKWI